MTMVRESLQERDSLRDDIGDFSIPVPVAERPPRGFQAPAIGAALLSVLAALTAAAAGAQAWWHLVNAPQPHFLIWLRLACLLSAVLICGGIALARHRIVLWLSAFWVLLAVSTLFVWIFLATQPQTMSDAIFQYKQIQRLSRIVWLSDYNLEAQWSGLRDGSASSIAKNDATLTDTIEIILFFSKGGWFLCVFACPLIAAAAYAEDTGKSRTVMRRIAKPGLVCLISPWILFGFVCAMSHFYYDSAQEAVAHGQYARALHLYRLTAAWDHRFVYDTGYRYQLGYVDGALHLTDNADYWAMLGDTMLQQDDVDAALLMYRMGAKLPSTPLFRDRYATAIQRSGFVSGLSGNYGDCLEKSREAERIAPQNLEIVYSLAVEATNSRDYASAIPLWRQLIDEVDSIGLFRSKYVGSYTYTKPTVARSWSALAFCYYKMGAYDQANLCVEASKQLKSTKTTSLDQSDQ